MTSTVRVEVAGVTLDVFGTVFDGELYEMDIRSRDNLIPILKAMSREGDWEGYDHLLEQIDKAYKESV